MLWESFSLELVRGIWLHNFTTLKLHFGTAVAIYTYKAVRMNNGIWWSGFCLSLKDTTETWITAEKYRKPLQTKTHTQAVMRTHNLEQIHMYTQSQSYKPFKAQWLLYASPILILKYFIFCHRLFMYFLWFSQ